ncbi:cerebral peptide 1 isoform X2 [Anopheles bellator]|uniref:cerebral peptide 1 isoform X2 n=1 Tax=Anopheles bellator TaxID=139047 RepID=UPI0026479663|nr:cerebral peptide 1 isoform X2 [Anopheles bellator]
MTMKLYRCAFVLTVTLMVSVLHAHCWSSEERIFANMAHLMERAKPPGARSIGFFLNGYGTAQDDSMLQERDDDDDGAPRLLPSVDYESAAENTVERQEPTPLVNEVKRSWNKINAAWGKRMNGHSRSAGWTKLGGSWGKREPGWNNLKGLWGKRADKLASAWGKRQEVSQVF